MKAIIFDMYGVILRDPYGNLVPYIRRYFPARPRDAIYQLWTALEGGSIDEEKFWRGAGFAHDWRGAEEEYLRSIDINEDFYAAAKHLRKSYRLALLSNDVSSWSARLRDRHKLNAFFDDVIVSGDIGLSKPDAEIFHHTLRRIALPASECLFIDDSGRNLRAARSVGMDTLHFNSRGEEPFGCSVGDYGSLMLFIGEKERRSRRP